MPNYNVHVYGICRVKVFNVNAANQHDATQKAYDAAVPVFQELPEDCPGDDSPPMGDCDAVFAGYSEEINGFLVDEQGDDQYVNSRDYDAQGQPLNSKADEKQTDAKCASELYREITKKAAQHADDCGEWEKEVGDLQVALADALNMLTVDQLQSLRGKLVAECEWFEATPLPAIGEHCPDEGCPGVIEADGLCSHCGDDYRDSK
jgi:hypothetical protein